MRKTFVFAVIAPFMGIALACGGGDPSTGGQGAEDCSACGSGEVCVSNLGSGKSTHRCVAIPSGCGMTASCGESDCVKALYALCETGWIGVGCSDTFPPTVVSCNPG